MLFFPSNCLVCGKRLPSPRAILCFNCEFKLPKTGFAAHLDNPVSQIFWGRVPVIAGTALFKFEKGSAYQALLHDLKYRGNIHAGIYLGNLLGQELVNTIFAGCELIVPVPLHRRRWIQRGYNQSEIIARGTSEIIGIPVETGLLRRKNFKSSQTSMNRHERFENTAAAFVPGKYREELQNKKVLLIDDVVTTGATLEACSALLISHFGCRVFIATVSCA